MTLVSANERLTRSICSVNVVRMSRTPDLAGALDAMKAITRGPRKKSPVYQWLAARYDGLSAAFRERPASWKALADYLGDGGVLNAEGQRPTPASVRSAWLRLETEMIRKRGQLGRHQPPGEPAANPQTHRSTPEDADLGDDAADQPDLNSFVKERR